MIPENEMGVIVLFSQLAKEAGFEIQNINATYPDAIIEKDRKLYKAEFEFKAKNFSDHKHDPKECDIIICWENNYENCPIPILALSEPNWAKTELESDFTKDKIINYWKERALIAEKRLSQLCEESAIVGSEKAVGRPRRSINPSILADYLTVNINDISISKANEIWGINRWTHDFYKKLSDEIKKNMNNSKNISKSIQ